MQRRSIPLSSLLSKAAWLAIGATLLLPAAGVRATAPPIYDVPPEGISQFPVRESPATDLYIQCEKLNGIGLTLPDYVLSDQNKKPFPLSQLKGKVIVLDIWLTDCGPCLKAMPALGRLAQIYRAKNVVFLSVCMNGDTEYAAFQKRTAQFSKTGLRFCFDPAGHDEKKNLRARLKNFMGMPTQIIINRSGKVSGALQGYDEAKDRDLTELKRSVDAALRSTAIISNVPAAKTPLRKS